MLLHGAEELDHDLDEERERRKECREHEHRKAERAAKGEIGSYRFTMVTMSSFLDISIKNDSVLIEKMAICPVSRRVGPEHITKPHIEEVLTLETGLMRT